MIARSRVTLITGTRKGIGRALAEHYVARGHVVVGCSRSAPDWQLDGYHHVLADVRDDEQVKAVISRIRKDHGRLDHLINNAGIAAMNHSLTTPTRTVRDVLDTNVLGTFLLCREAAKLMQKHKTGRIVNFATVATPLRLEGEAIYAASKAAVISLTQILARELGPLGITVNAVGPCPIATDLIAGVPEAKLGELVARQAIRRFATFADVTNVVDFFLRDESELVTGQTIFLGGVS